jgi:hypothetical protein
MQHYTENLLTITEEINAGKGTIGLLLNDAELARDLKQTMHYLKYQEEKPQMPLKFKQTS